MEFESKKNWGKAKRLAHRLKPFSRCISSCIFSTIAMLALHYFRQSEKEMSVLPKREIEPFFPPLKPISHACQTGYIFIDGGANRGDNLLVFAAEKSSDADFEGEVFRAKKFIEEKFDVKPSCAKKSGF